MRKNSIKNTRVNEEVRRKLSEIIRGSIKDPRIHPMTSIVSVEVAPDLKTCKAYVSVLVQNCRVNQQVQHYKIFLKKHSVGVLKFSFSLGLALIFILILLIFPSVTVLMSVPFGIYCLTSLFSFSTAPFCHEQ